MGDRPKCLHYTYPDDIAQKNNDDIRIDDNIA